MSVETTTPKPKRRALRMILWTAAGLVGALVMLIAVVATVGATLPKGHVVTRSVTIPKPREEVWSVVSDFVSQPKWRPSVKGVSWAQTPKGEILSESVGRYTIDLRTAEVDPPRKVVREIVGDNLPFSGSWEFTLEPTADHAGCVVTIVERGEVPNPIFRFVSKYVMGHAATAESYLNDLARKFGVAPPYS